MGFLENIKSDLGLFDFPDKPCFTAVILGDKGAYFECVKTIKNYTSTEIIFSTSCGVITISGENLFIKKFCMGDLSVCGKINSLKKE